MLCASEHKAQDIFGKLGVASLRYVAPAQSIRNCFSLGAFLRFIVLFARTWDCEATSRRVRPSLPQRLNSTHRLP